MPRRWHQKGFVIIVALFIVGALWSFSTLKDDCFNNVKFAIHDTTSRKPPLVPQRNASCPSDLSPLFAHPAYPNCLSKMEWMKVGWQTDECYALYGVDGSTCSFYLYLSEVENYCPPLLPASRNRVSVELNATRHVDDLFALMVDNAVNFKWMQARIRRMFSSWTNAVHDLTSRIPEFNSRRRLNVVFFLGFLSKEVGFKFGEKSDHGGPLGELVQWSDLIASTYMLGHNISIASEFSYFKSNTVSAYLSSNACPKSPGNKLDLIFTDIVGLRKIKRSLKDFYSANKCRIRLLDSFGTHAEFNLQAYYSNHWAEFGRKKNNPWGGHGLELQQFLTLYPHTDDNTFLGFVVELFESDPSEQERQNWTLVYGKEKYMWNDSAPILKVVREYSELHATVADADDTFMKEFGLVNHKLLTGPDFHALLRKSRVFLGLGFPLEGPAPLEAIANGAIFINPSFDPPKSRLTYKPFADKPTLRELHSQNPYMERFVGPPYVLTVNVTNSTALEIAMKTALATPPQTYLPAAFLFTGMLSRVDIILTKQDFCQPSPSYPDWKLAKITFADSSDSCEQACAKQKLVCERSFFHRLNKQEIVTNFTECGGVFRHEGSLVAPARCLLQADPMLFSCAAKPKSNEKRICPCRTYSQDPTVP